MRLELTHKFCGGAKKKEVTPDGHKDESVFDIEQGVSIGLFVKNVSRGS